MLRSLRKFDEVLYPNFCKDFTSCFVEHISFAVIGGLEPHLLQEAPNSLGYVEMGTVRRKEKYVETSLLPFFYLACHCALPMEGGVVKHDESWLGYLFGESVKIGNHFVPSDGVRGVKSAISAVRADHSEYVEPFLLQGWHKNIFIVKLPAVGHIAACADMAFVSEVKVDGTDAPQFYKFLQLSAFELHQLRRGLVPWAFSYTLISCANKSKKRLKVDSLTSLFDAACHSAFAVFTLSRCFLTASLTASVSAEPISGFGPRPPFSLRPSRPASSYRASHLYMASFPYPTIGTMSWTLMPSALSNTPRQRMRKRWHAPKRYPLSNSERCSGVNIMSFVLPMMCVYYSIYSSITLGV